MTSRRLCLIAALIAFGLAATALRPPRTPGPFARDFEAYYAAGATWNAGGDPWSREVWPTERSIEGVVATRDELLPFVGPAPTLLLWSPLARLPFAAATVVWLAILALAFVVLIAASLALTGRRPARIEIASAGTFALASGPMLSDIALGQAALPSAAAVALAMAAFPRHLAAASAATLVAAIQPNLALSLAAYLTRRRAFVAIAIAAAAFFALTLIIGGGLPGLRAYLHDLAAHGEAERFITIQYALPGILASFGAPHAGAIAVAAAVAALVALWAGLAALCLRERPQLAGAIAIALLPLAVPFFHEHDFVLVVVAAIVILRYAGGRERTLATVSALAIFVDWFGMAQRPPAQGQIVALALGVALAITAYAAREPIRPPDLAPVLTALALALISVPLAKAFPAPTWPDALSVSYHAAPGAGASSVWAEEQRLAGLQRDVPAWGVLRAIPLAGCTGLAIAGTLAALRCRRS